MSHEKQTCPCKRLPQFFSSFTAAEFGDIHALSQLGPSVSNRRDAAGYSPLHFAAQNGHVAATSLLLQLGVHVDGRLPPGSTTPDNVRECGATPLHRASFSGAVATMQILLQWNTNSDNNEQSCNMLSRDISFGDCMTPLHKAAAGGRYLAVQLLLEALRSRIMHDHVEGELEEPLLLQKGLAALDSTGRTPLALAKCFIANQKEEQKSVRRWDEVAGGEADWVRCAQLLSAVEKELQHEPSPNNREQAKSKGTVQTLEPIPKHLSGPAACLDCGPTDDGRCLTSSWESAFLSVLTASVTETVKKGDYETATDKVQEKRVIAMTQSESEMGMDTNTTNGDVSFRMKNKAQNDERLAAVGHICSLCGVRCFALYKRRDRTFACRSCAKK